jgi:hypothetical protein
MTLDFQINQIADREFGRVNTPPANYYIALLTTIPNPNGTNAVEVSTIGTGYARQILPNNKTSLTSSNNGQVSNIAAINYPAATANWGIVACVGIYDAPTGGNLLYISVQPTAKAYDSGDIAFFDIGDIVWTVQNIQD